MSKIKIRPVTIGLLILTAILVIVGIVYLTRSASDLPAFFPGHEAHSTHHHVKHALAAFTLAAVALVVAWVSTSPGDQPSS